jgi:hypothetical protein
MESEERGGTGSCLCGAVRYRYRGEPATVGLCQCERCQRQSGSAFLIGVIFAKEAVSIEGELHTYEACIDGHLKLRRHFCPVCGSAVSITLDRFPEIRSMMGGTLDNKADLKPGFSVWTSAGQPWLQLPQGIQCFAEYPDGTFG